MISVTLRTAYFDYSAILQSGGSEPLDPSVEPLGPSVGAVSEMLRQTYSPDIRPSLPQSSPTSKQILSVSRRRPPLFGMALWKMPTR